MAQLPEQNLDYLQDLVENVNDLIQIVRPDGSFHYANRAWRETLGYRPDEIPRLLVFDIIHPDSRSHCEQLFRRVLAGEKLNHIEANFVAKDGRAIAVEGSVHCRFEHGQPIATRSIFRDVTERKRAEEAAREQKEILDALNEVGKVLSAELNLERLVQAVSDAGTRLSGAQFGAFFYNVLDEKGEAYLLHTLSGAPREAFAGFPMPRNTDVFRPTFEGRGIVRLDDVTQDPRYGRNAPYHGMPRGHLPVRSYLAAPVMSRSGKVLGGLFFGHAEIGVFQERAERLVSGMAAAAAVALDNAHLFQALQHELAERKRADETRRLLDERFRLVWNNSADGLRLTDADGIVVMINDAFCQMVMLSREAMEGQSLAVIQPPERRERVIHQHCERFRSRTVPLHLERKLTLWNGKQVWFELTNTLLEGVQPLLLSVFRDTSQRKQAEEALRESRHMLDVVLNNIPQGVFWKDRRSAYLGCNQVVCRALAVAQPSDLIGKTDVDFPSFSREQADFFIQKDREVMDGNAPEYGIIEQMTRADGPTIWLETHKIPLRDVQGQVVGVLGTWQDITERKLAEEALRDSERELADFFEHATLGLHWIGPDGLILRVNQCELNMLGYTREEYLGHHIAEFHADKQVIGDILQRLARGEELHDYPAELKCKDGSIRQVLISSNVFWENGRFVHARCLTRDITERKWAEEALRQSEERLRLVAEATLDAHYDWDIRSNTVWRNDGYQRLYGREAVGDDSDWWMRQIHPDDRDAVMAGIRSAFQGRQRTWSGQYRFQRHQGDYAFVLDRGYIEYDATGQAVRFLGAITDLTERVRAEEERRQLEARVQQAQRVESLGMLAGGIAHDFNNLLTSMLGYASLAQSQLPPASAAGPMLQEIEKAARRAADLTCQMLAYSGKGRFVIQVMGLDSLVQEMAKLLETIVSKKAVLHLELRPAAIEGDATQIRQIVMNLITNASDALGDEGGAIVLRTGARHADAASLRSAYLHDDLPEGLYAYVEVQDSGCGMSEETLTKIFDPFYTTKFTGRGLGLAAVLGIVRGHRGAIQVTSQSGAGTTFQVLFPCAAPLPAETLAARPEAGPWKGEGTILVVEDEEDVRTFARHVLEGSGFQVLMACDGREGLEVYGRHRKEIRAVVLDWTMPRLDGAEAVRQLRCQQPDVPILVMSGYSEQVVSTRVAGLGVNAFLPKPFRPADLIARVRQMLSS